MAYGDIKRLNTATSQLAATVGTLYTAPSAKRTQIGSIILHNTSSTNNRTAEVFDNGTAASNKLLSIVLSANQTYEFSPKVPLVLSGGETLQGNSDAATTVNVRIYGREET
jgi:hypothetical protein